MHVSWAPEEAEALKIAHDQWRTNEPATMPMPEDCTRLADLLGTDDAAPGEKVTVEPYGFRWFRSHG